MALMFIWSCSQDQVGTLPYYNTPDFSPRFITAKDSVDMLIPHHIGDFSFLDQHGRSFTSQDLRGKVHVADFIFTSCGSICPVMTEHMKLVDSAYRHNPDVVILSYSVTPWIDSVARLRAYAEAKGISSPQWHFLTGSKGAIYDLARRSYFAEEDLGFTRDSSEFLHTEHVILVDGDGRIRGIYNGTLLLDMQQLVKDIAVLRRRG